MLRSLYAYICVGALLIGVASAAPVPASYAIALAGDGADEDVAASYTTLPTVNVLAGQILQTCNDCFTLTPQKEHLQFNETVLASTLHRHLNSKDEHIPAHHSDISEFVTYDVEEIQPRAGKSQFHKDTEHLVAVHHEANRAYNKAAAHHQQAEQAHLTRAGALQGQAAQRHLTEAAGHRVWAETFRDTATGYRLAIPGLHSPNASRAREIQDGIKRAHNSGQRAKQSGRLANAGSSLAKKAWVKMTPFL